MSILNTLTEEQANQQYSVGDIRNERVVEDGEGEENTVVISNLASHISKQFYINKDDRNAIEAIMLSSLESMNNTYDSSTLNEIRKMGGSEIFMPLTSQLVSSGTSWINSILDAGWTIGPSPIPELPSDVKEQVMSSLEQTMRGPETPKTPEGIPMGAEGGPMQTPEVDQIKDEKTKEALTAINDEAEKRSSKMSKLIEDQLLDSDWDSVLDSAIHDLGVFPNCFIKTVYKPVKKMVTTVEGDRFTLVAKTELVEVDERVSPLDIFPSPDQTHPNNGSLIERLKLSRKSLYDSIGVPGYREDAIREVLQQYDQNGLEEWQTSVDTQVRVIEGHDTHAPNHITGLRFMGPVKAKDLIEWAADDTEWPWIKELDVDSDVEIDAILVGNHVIKAIPILDPLGHRKYYTASFRKVSGSFWGVSPAMLIKPHQKLVNATVRALSNNMGIASGPMSYILMDRLPQGESLGAYHPWKQFQMTSDPNGANVPPISFFQPNDNSQNLLGVYQHYMQEAYGVAGIPRGAMDGATSRMGSGDHTASGIASELENASKAIRMAVRNIERDIIVKRIEDQYRTNMIYSDDDSVKGDYCVVAKGASSSIAKAVDNQQSIELLNSLAGGPGAELVGMEGFAAILGRIASNNDMPELIPTKEELRDKQKAQQEQQQKPPPTPEEVKLQIEQIRAETRIKDQELEDRNAAAERETRLQIAQMELQGKQLDHQVKMELAQKSEEQQIKVTALQSMNANARAKDANKTKLLAEQMKKAAT